MKVLRSKLLIFLCLPLGCLLIVDSFSISKEFGGVCTKVLDGDTIVVSGVKIRLAHIDAPESRQRSYDGKEIGQMSTNYLKNLILGKKVIVQFSKKGRYGRILGIILYKGEVNYQMIESGMAMAYERSASIKYKSAQYQSRLLRKGIFGTQGFHRPSFYRKIRRGL